GVQLSDFGLAIRHDKNLQSAFYFADSGPAGFGLGECSHRVGKDLGGSTTRHGFDNNFPVSFIVFPRSGGGIQGVFGLPDQTIEAGVQTPLFNLSRATNAYDLVSLMAFNEVPARHTPQGLQKLKHYLRNPGSPNARHYSTVLLGLAAYGFQPYLAAPRK